MKIQRIETPGIAHFAYVIADGTEAAVVDPGRFPEPYLEAAAAYGARITHIIETHRQEDFMMGSSYLAQQTGAQVVNGDFETFGHGDVRLQDGETFDVGNLHFKALHTPGHTPESMCYLLCLDNDSDKPWGIFTGDTLFFGTTGRTDLPDANRSVENAGLLYDSVHSKLARVADTALVFPAHGPGSVCGSGMAEKPYSTLGDERLYNDVFILSRDDFARKKGGENNPRPPYFRLMERLNLEGGRPPRKSANAVSLLGPSEFHDNSGGKLIFDTREPEGFGGGHVPGSHSIWMGGLSVFGGWIADENSSVYLLTERDGEIEEAAKHLERIGIDGVAGALSGGFSTWRKSGLPIESSGTITPRELAQHRDDFQILDVREIDEFDSGHIDGAVNVFVGYLKDKINELDFDKQSPVVVTCGVGHRAGLGVSILLQEGFTDVRNLLGGMSAWNTLELPVES